MRVDLHNHTPSSILNGDSIKWVSTSDSIKNMFQNKVGAFSFTDHNTFSKTRFTEAKKISGKHLIVFPGIEINIKRESGIVGHVLYIFDNKLSDAELSVLEDLSKKNLKKRGIKIEEASNIFKDFKKIIIPHVGKGDYFPPSELNFEHDAIEITSYTHPNYKKWQKANIEKSIVAFSDTHIWNNYPQNKNLTTKIDFDGSFEDLKQKLRLNKNYTEVI